MERCEWGYVNGRGEGEEGMGGVHKRWEGGSRALVLSERSTHSAHLLN